MERNNFLEEDEITIDIGELISALWSKIHIIILVAFIFACTSFAATKLFITPKYDSMTRIYVIAKQNESVITFNDLQTGTQLTKDYIEMVRSRPVMESVIKKLNLQMSPGKLASSVKAVRIPDTRMIKIIVRNEDPEMAKKIADAVRDAASVQIKKVMNIDAVNTVEEASLPVRKSTPNTKKNTLIGGCLGGFLVMVIIVICFLKDDTIKTSEDVERYLQSNVLALIPVEKKNKGIKRENRKNNGEVK